MIGMNCSVTHEPRRSTDASNAEQTASKSRDRGCQSVLCRTLDRAGNRHASTPRGLSRCLAAECHHSCRANVRRHHAQITIIGDMKGRWLLDWRDGRLGGAHELEIVCAPQSGRSAAIARRPSVQSIQGHGPDPSAFRFRVQTSLNKPSESDMGEWTTVRTQ